MATLFVLVLVSISLWHDKLLPPTKRDFVSWETQQEDLQREMKIYLPIAILFLTGQAAFIANLLGGLIKKFALKK